MNVTVVDKTPNQATNHFSQHCMCMPPTHQKVESLSPCESGLALWLTLTNRRWWKRCLFQDFWAWVLRELATSASSFYAEAWLPWNHRAVRKPKPDPERDHTEEHGGTRHGSEAVSDLLDQPNTVSSWEQPNESSHLIPHGAEESPSQALLKLHNCKK